MRDGTFERPIAPHLLVFWGMFEAFHQHQQPCRGNVSIPLLAVAARDAFISMETGGLEGPHFFGTFWDSARQIYGKLVLS